MPLKRMWGWGELENGCPGSDIKYISLLTREILLWERLEPFSSSFLYHQCHSSPQNTSVQHRYITCLEAVWSCSFFYSMVLSHIPLVKQITCWGEQDGECATVNCSRTIQLFLSTSTSFCNAKEPESWLIDNKIHGLLYCISISMWVSMCFPCI